MTRTIAVLAVLTALALGVPAAAHAHFIWIETDPKAAPGSAHGISIYFGEPHESLREEAGGLLDRHDALRAWIVDPAGERIALTLRKERNRFHGSFTPTRVGRHNVIALSDAHPVLDLTAYERPPMRPVFYARTQFLVFAKGRLSEREPAIKELLDYDVVPVTRGPEPLSGSVATRAGHEVVIRLLSKGQPVVRRRLQVFGPNGWIKELQPTDAWGVASFVPLWPGRYVVALERDDKMPGELDGKRYETLSQRVTFSLLAAGGIAKGE